jgi:integrase
VIEGFYLLGSSTNLVDALEMNLFLQERYLGKYLPPTKGGHRNELGGITIKTIKSISNSLRVFLSWIESVGLDWHEVTASSLSDKAKEWLPVYRFKSYLIERTKSGEISRDTASLYLSHVRQFYEWARKKLRVEKLPFKYEQKIIKKRRKDGELDFLIPSSTADRGIVVTTSDLVIPKKYKQKNYDAAQGLVPFSNLEIKAFFSSEYMNSPARQLWAELSLYTGLRAFEVSEFKENLVVNPSINDFNVYTVTIEGGKFYKSRKIMIPRYLMVKLNEYKNSNTRLNRAKKWDQVYGLDKPRNLFINRSGKPISEASVSNLTSKVKGELAKKGISFNRSFHEFRSTFATSLTSFMLEKSLPLGFIQYKIMSLLGHVDFSTTAKYINYARSFTFEEQMQDWVERIFTDLESSLKIECAGMEED